MRKENFRYSYRLAEHQGRPNMGLTLPIIGSSVRNVKNHAALIEFGATETEPLYKERALWIDEPS